MNQIKMSKPSISPLLPKSKSNKPPLFLLWLRIKNHTIPILLGICALAIYLPGIGWGLPHVTNPQMIHGWDIDSVSGMIVLAEFHNLLVQAKPDWWIAYPLFHYLVLALFYVPYLAYLFLTGGFTAPSATYPYGFADPVGAIATLTLIARALTVLMASGVVVMAYLIARTVWDKTTGIVAAVAVMLTAPIVYYARTGNLDIPVLFWLGLAILVLAKSVTTGLTIRRAIWLGVFSALAVATKDQAYAALLPGLAALALLHLRNSATTGISLVRSWKPLFALATAGSLAYAVASGLVISPQRFFLHLQYISNFKESFYNIVRPDGQVMYGSGGNVLRASTPAGYALLTQDIGVALFESLGPLLLIAGVIGVLIAWRATPFSRVVIIMGLGHLILAVLPVRHMQYRYAIFPSFVLAFFIARAIVVGWHGTMLPKALAAGFVILGFGWLGIRGTDLTYQMLYDARLATGKCLEKNLRPGDQVGYFGGINQLPPLPKGITPVLLPADESAIDILQQKRVRFVIISPDAWSDPGMDRCWLIADSIYAKLQDGSLGYERLARFCTEPLLGQPLKYLPIVNPPAQIFGSPDDRLIGCTADSTE